MLDKQKTRYKNLKTRYKVSKEMADFIDLKFKHCEICKTKFTDNNIKCYDHDHDTGNLRGILCNSCNLGLGFFKDNRENLKKAIEYLNNTKDM